MPTGKKLKTRDLEIIRLYLQGEKQINIARKLKLRPETIIRKLKSPEIQKIIQRDYKEKETALDILLAAQPQAAKRMIELAQDKKSKIVSFNATKEILKGVLSEKHVVRVAEIKESDGFKDA